MNLTAIVKPSLQLLPSLTKNLCRNFGKWTQWNAASKPNSLNQFCGTAKLMCNTNLTLIPKPMNVIMSCGMKAKGILKLRCTDCYFYRKGIQLFVYCDSHPRHKQMSILPPRKTQWLLSHACMSKKRPY